MRRDGSVHWLLLSGAPTQAHKHLSLQSQGTLRPPLTSKSTSHMWYRDMQTGKILTYKNPKIIKKKKKVDVEGRDLTAKRGL